MKNNKTFIAGLALATLLFLTVGDAQAGGRRGSSRSTRSSGSYKSGSGSSHKGGHYKNTSTNDHYKKRK